jgi:DNA recombination protein RmuC
MESYLVGIAALAGILIGFWLRSLDVRADIALLEKTNRDITDAFHKVRSDLEKAADESKARASFESLASEREKIIGQMTAEHDRLRAEVQAKTDAERAQATRVSELEADLRNERQKTGEALEKKSKSLSEGTPAELGNLLSSLREQLKEFREKVEKVQTDSTSGVTRLETLIGALGGLNQKLADEARNISTALRGSAKAQGDWGEFILRDLLEKAGLREGEQYSFQQSFGDVEREDAGGRRSRQTDVIVHLPGGRHLVIDSKVSLNSYTDSVNAELEDNRAEALREHLKSVRSHVSNLAKTNYHGLPGIQSPDFVMMFVPIEPAYLVALKSDPELWADAYAKGVLLVGPTTLLYVIRIVSMLWRQEDQNRAVREVTDYGAALYTRFAAFVSDMDSLGESLHSASARYDVAKNKLSAGSDNLVRQFDELKRLGARFELARPAESLSIKWVPAAGPDRDSGEPQLNSRDASEPIELTVDATVETNGYHREQAEELQLEDASYFVS